MENNNNNFNGFSNFNGSQLYNDIDRITAATIPMSQQTGTQASNQPTQNLLNNGNNTNGGNNFSGGHVTVYAPPTANSTVPQQNMLDNDNSTNGGNNFSGGHVTVYAPPTANSAVPQQTQAPQQNSIFGAGVAIPTTAPVSTVPQQTQPQQTQPASSIVGTSGQSHTYNASPYTGNTQGGQIPNMSRTGDNNSEAFKSTPNYAASQTPANNYSANNQTLTYNASPYTGNTQGGQIPNMSRIDDNNSVAFKSTPNYTASQTPVNNYPSNNQTVTYNASPYTGNTQGGQIPNMSRTGDNNSETFNSTPNYAASQTPANNYSANGQTITYNVNPYSNYQGNNGNR